MSLSNTRLGDALADFFIGQLPVGLEPSPADEATFRNTMRDTANEIILEFTGFAVVSTTVPGTGLIGNLGSPITGTANGSGGMS